MNGRPYVTAKEPEKRTTDKSSPVPEMDDRGPIDIGRKEGDTSAFRGELRPRLIQCGWAEVHFRIKWRLHPSSRLATIDMGQKLGGCGCALFIWDSWVPIEHSRLGRGLTPHQVAS